VSSLTKVKRRPGTRQDRPDDDDDDELGWRRQSSERQHRRRLRPTVSDYNDDASTSRH